MAAKSTLQARLMDYLIKSNGQEIQNLDLVKISIQEINFGN
jgi:hypothetical protein